MLNLYLRRKICLRWLIIRGNPDLTRSKQLKNITLRFNLTNREKKETDNWGDIVSKSIHKI